MAARSAVEPEERQEVTVGAIEPDCRVGDDREEGDNPGADQERQKRLLYPDDDQRRDRHDWRHLQHHGIREEAELEYARQREQHRDPAAENGGCGECGERDAQGHQQRAEQAGAVGPQAHGDLKWAG